MAGSLSNYAEDAILKWLTGQSTQPTSTTGGITARLLTANPTETGTTTTGTAVTSGTGTGGTAVAVSGTDFNAPALTTASWAFSSSGDSMVATYNLDITFTNSGSSTVTVNGVGLYVGGSGGNLLAWTDFLASKQLAPTETLVIPSGTLKLQLN